MENIEKLCVNELRVLSNEMITNAKSGHPGIALGSAPIVFSLLSNVMAISPDDDKNFNRDRFVLSAGHGSSILYATLNAMGFDISKEDLTHFRSLGSKTPGHPEIEVPGIDANTGPLGQGVSNAVGLAIAQKHFASKFNKKDIKLFDSTIYCMVGDGCLMEGISYEALSLAGALKLDNFVLLYDCNKITIEGKTNLTFVEDINLRFKSIGFDVFHVKNGNSTSEITKTILKAKKSSKPAIVVVPTVIGFGSELAGSEKIHGSPLSNDALEELKVTLNVSKPPFELSKEVKDYFSKKQQEAKQRLLNRDKLEEYKQKYPQEFALFEVLFDENFSKYVEDLKKVDVPNNLSTTRDINFEMLNKIAKIVPNFFGGSADVATSTKAYIKTDNHFSFDNYSSNFIHYGVREHAMAGISNGISLFGGLLPYQSCFLSFVDYLKPALRMSALMNLRILSVFSHDSFTAGQDGPTHQPIEQLPSLRLTPNLIVSRPYNATEILATYIWLLQNKKPVCMLVSKDNMQFQNSKLDDALKGGYVLKENKNAAASLISTGADVDRCLQVSKILESEGIETRVVSIPCVSIFESQTPNYKKSVLKDLPKVFVEASAENCWLKFANSQDYIISVDHFGKSGNPSEVTKYFGFDIDSLTKNISKWLKNIKK